MWFGLLHSGDQVIVVAYEERRLFRVGAPLSEVPAVLTFMRTASDGGRRLVPPRCSSCDAPLEVPPLDEEVPECASA